jgi:hypothetical protein
MLTEGSDELLNRHLIGAQALPFGDDAPCHHAAIMVGPT